MSRQPNILLDILAAILAAVLLALPGFAGALWPVAFIAFVPILWRINNRGWVAAFLIPFLAFFLYVTHELVWIHQYGWHWLFLETSMNSITYAIIFPFSLFIRRKLGTDPGYITLPILYLIAEYSKSMGFFSLPWPYLSSGQYANLPFIQISEFTGGWGVTFLIVWFNSALFGIIANPDKRRAIVNAIFPIVAVAANFAYGFAVLSKPMPQPKTTSSVFQRDVSTQREWTPFVNDLAWTDYRGLTLEEWTQRLGSKPGGFVVWPEGAIPDALDDFPSNPDEEPRKSQIYELVRRMHKVFIIGTQTEDERGPYNAAAVFGPGGALLGIYRKVHLVPFGEVIPMEKYIKEWFPEYPWGSESLVNGTELKGIDTPEGKIGIVICYESFFPDLTRRIVNDGCDYLFLITNTSWFGRSDASYEHAHYDTFRAVENRIWLSRAATTGISSFIDPYGRRYDETELYVKDARSHLISPRLKETLYTRWGDWFPRLCLVLGLMLTVVAVYRKNL